MSTQLIGAHHISKRFEGVQALGDVSITIQQGEVRCLAGENGSGKSTLIKILAGVYRPDSGEIHLQGKVFSHLSARDAIRQGIQVIYQDFSLFPNLTIAENLAFNTLLEHNRRIVKRKDVQRIAVEALARLNIHLDLRKTVAEVGVADKQLISIARALLHDAKLIIMDEPTTALTQREVDVLYDIIQQLKGNGVSILFVSHKLNELLEISEQVTILRNGRKVAEGMTSDFEYPKLVYHITGRELSEGRYSYTEEIVGAQAVLKVDNLSALPAFRDVSFDLKCGEIVGITGLLGSGRTELAHSLFGMCKTDSGNIYLNGQKVSLDSPQQAITHGIAYVPEDRLTEGLFLEQSIEKNIVVSIITSMLGVWSLIDNLKVIKEVTRWLDKLKITAASTDMPVQDLSGGNQQKIVLAKWLATKAHVLILNGPTVGVDIGSKTDIHEKIRSLARDGLSIIIISDDVTELIRTCNRLLIIHRGRIEKNINTVDISENELIYSLMALK